MIIKLFAMLVMWHCTCVENIGDSFSMWNSPPKMVITIYWKYSFDRNDESELAILPQKCDRSPEWWSDRIGDRLWYGFDWERIQAEKKRP